MSQKNAPPSHKEHSDFLLLTIIIMMPFSQILSITNLFSFSKGTALELSNWKSVNDCDSYSSKNKIEPTTLSMPSMALQRAIIQDTPATKDFESEFTEETEKRSSIVIADHENNLRENKTLHSPLSIHRASTSWKTYNKEKNNRQKLTSFEKKTTERTIDTVNCL